MKTHGGGPSRQNILLGNGLTVSAPVAPYTVPDADDIPGFRNFLGKPTSGQVAGSAHQAASPAQLRQRMYSLARRMTSNLTVSGALPGTTQRDNKAIPSGYTYLLQFMAHDLVATSIPFWAADDLCDGTRNGRTSRLRLETLYGGGPMVNPAPYQPDDDGDTSRTKLRLGQFDGAGTPPRSCPFRDLARTTVPSMNSEMIFSEPLISDGRNDDNVILAQLTVLFQALHNVIVNEIDPCAVGKTAEPVEAASRRFACARAATTLIFRTIIRDDLLPRILHPKVRSRYSVPAPVFLDAEFKKNPSGRLPLEFSHGALRFGHAMARNSYQLNATNPRPSMLCEVLNQTSSRRPGEMPLSVTWLINWSQFFELNPGVTPNLSQLIGPTMSPGLTDRSLFGPIDSDPSTPPDDGRAGLPYRDLISATLAGLWSVDALVWEIGQRNPALVAALPGLTSPALYPALAQWLRADQRGTGLTAADIAAIAADPPLPFYILFEAEAQTDGETLGPLGSIIIADVIYAILAEEPFAVPTGASLRTTLAALSDQYQGQYRLDGLVTITTMPELVKFVANRAGWQACQPPFI